MRCTSQRLFIFFFPDPATTEIYTLSLHDALPISSPELLGLCLDTGHATYGGGDPLSLLTQYRDRVWHVHFKDCSRDVASRARAGRCDYLSAIRHGLLWELARGSVAFACRSDQLNASGF